MRGLGWWDNIQARRMLDLVLGRERGEIMEANAIEDAALVLLSHAGSEGFLDARVAVSGVTVDGRNFSHELDNMLTTGLPRPLEAREVRLRVIPGRRYTIKAVTFAGLDGLAGERGGGGGRISEKEARGFFAPRLGVLTPADAKAFSPGRLRGSVASLRETLRNLGYVGAQVSVADERRDAKTGEVRLHVLVEPGPFWRISGYREEIDGDTGPMARVKLPPPGSAWSRTAGQDLEVLVRNVFYDAGYADARVTVAAVPPESPEPPGADGVLDVVVTVRVIPGEAVRVGRVRFEGRTRVRDALLASKVALHPGDPFDPRDVETGRLRLSRLGVFEMVDSRADPETGPERDAVFFLKEQPRWDTSLMFGYGSYEQLRGGVELRQNNLWGLAHRTRLELVQSMKSSQGDYTYSIPELLGKNIDGSVKVFGLLREEESFDREEYGGSLLLRRPVRKWRMEVSGGYTFESLHASDSTLGTRATDLDSSRVGSLNFGLVQDRRDNPLQPHSGYRWYAQLENAEKWLGGDVDYQRIELDWSWHLPLGGERWLHLGLSHGVVLGDKPVPVNKLFFPGGENSIRGYKAGEAAPRDDTGAFVGVRSQVVGNVELEQRVTGNWSAVVFLDALGTATSMDDYPFDETLFSIGGGVRYQTIIGPVRLEYGYNLKRRDGDPAGTVLFSLGFPF
ncbi:outer membrane protein assembly factor [Opitutaceae bacterium TAV4]|nr:outer membrane protein assembly factor [Opitutaceae bacterium TAV4]